MLLTLDIEAQSPLVFAARKPGQQFRSSLPYIPGAVIYGGLGRQLELQGSFDPQLVRALRCHNAYPIQCGDEWSRPLPLTAIQLKGSNDTHGDILVRQVCWGQQQPPAVIDTLADQRGRLWEFARAGYYTLRGQRDASGLYGSDTRVKTRKVAQRVLTRVAINRQRGTAEDQRLYSPLVLHEVSSEHRPTQFRSSLIVPDGDQMITAALAEIKQLGGRQSTGLGLVEIATTPTSEETGATIAARVAALTARFQSQAEVYTSLGGTPWPIAERTIFTVNLLADAILLEHGWLPTTTLSAETLRELTGIEATLVRSFTAAVTAGGWNVIWQRPKATALATVAGSVFVFQAHAPLDPAACARLADLQRAGIGERRPEGYGQVRICDDVHLLDDRVDEEPL